MSEHTAARRAITLVFLANGLLIGAWGARIPALRERLDLGEGELGLVLAFVAAGALVAMPAAGAWSARVGTRRTTRTIGAVWFLAPAAAFSAPTLGVLLLAALLVGATNGALDVSMNAQGTTVERRSGRLLLGKLHAAFSGGGLLGAGSGAIAAAAGIDARVQLLVLGLVATAAFVPVTRALLTGDEAQASAGPHLARPDRTLLALGLLAFCCLLAEGAALDWSAVYVTDDLGASAAYAATAYAAFSATMLLGRLFSDRLVEHVGAGVLLRGGGAVAGGGLAVALAVGEPAAALAGFAALGAGLSVVVPLVFRAAAATSDGAAAPPLAAVSTMGYTGFLAGPPIIGAIAELSSLRVSLLLVSVLAASAVVLAPAVTRPAARTAARAAPGTAT